MFDINKALNDISTGNYGYLENQLKELQGRYNIVDRKEFKELVNFSKNSTEPFHNWFYYKEGYSYELVARILSRFGCEPSQKVLDPFCGVGTTLLTSKMLGIDSVGFDVNPISIFVAEAKLQKYTNKDITDLDNIIKDFTIDDKKRTSRVPVLSILGKIFSQEQLFDLLKLKGYIESFEGTSIFYPLKVAYLSIIESVSNMKKDGNGIKYLKNPKPKNVEHQFIEKLKEFVRDIRRYQEIFPVTADNYLINDSFLNCKNYPLDSQSIDHIIFSPPYANCFDYCAVYKMELWMGDFVKSYPDFRKLRDLAIRSHVNGSVDKNLENKYDLIDWISEQVNTFKLWDKKIPLMIRAYFDDMTKVLQECHRVLKAGKFCAIVVANSSYKGFIVPTDLMLSYIAESIGFEVEEIGVCRNQKTSSQQMNNVPLLKSYLRESVIILKKK